MLPASQRSVRALVDVRPDRDLEGAERSCTSAAMKPRPSRVVRRRVEPTMPAMTKSRPCDGRSLQQLRRELVAERRDVGRQLGRRVRERVLREPDAEQLLLPGEQLRRAAPACSRRSRPASGVATSSPKRSNIVVWPVSRSLLALWAMLRMRSRLTSSEPRASALPAIESSAPALTRLSRARLLTLRVLSWRQKSSRMAKAPPASCARLDDRLGGAVADVLDHREAEADAGACRPACASRAKLTPLLLTSGGSTGMPRRTHSL